LPPLSPCPRPGPSRQTARLWAVQWKIIILHSLRGSLGVLFDVCRSRADQLSGGTKEPSLADISQPSQSSVAYWLRDGLNKSRQRPAQSSADVAAALKRRENGPPRSALCGPLAPHPRPSVYTPLDPRSLPLRPSLALRRPLRVAELRPHRPRPPSRQLRLLPRSHPPRDPRVLLPPSGRRGLRRLPR